MNRRVTCEYCNRPAEMVGGNVLYPHRPDLAHRYFWRCTPCAAYVGCHPGTTTPLGRLAKAELRRAKQRVHAALDPHWRSKRMSRKEAYAKLAAGLGIAPQNCHVGMFTLEQCEAALCVLSGWEGEG